MTDEKRERRDSLTMPQRAKLAELRQKRWNIDSIAAELGCSVGTVAWRILVDGVDIHPDRPLPPVPTAPIVRSRGGKPVRLFTQAEDGQLLELEADGLPYIEIGRRLGRRHNSIIGRLATLARRDARSEARDAGRRQQAS